MPYEDGTPMDIPEALVFAADRLAFALRQLGLADAATPFGAIEALCDELKEASTRIADGLHAIADAIVAHGDPSA
jgi:hypothetical protein